MLRNLLQKGAGLAVFSLLASKVSSEAVPEQEIPTEKSYSVPGQTLRKCQVGIDLGTTFTCVYIHYSDNKSYEILTYDRPTQLTLPSTLYFENFLKKDTKLPVFSVGYAANAKNSEEPSAERYIYGFKRIVGVPSIDDPKVLESFNKSIHYKTRKETVKGKSFYSIPIMIEGKEFAFTATEFSSLILSEIKSRLDNLGLDITSLTISTPAYFSSMQDSEVRMAASMAGFIDQKDQVTGKPKEILFNITKEPVAACICYSKDFSKESLNKDENVLVFDIGGGTTDLSLLEVNTEDVGGNQFDSSLIVKRFSGNNFLGGENFTAKLAEYCLKEAVKSHNVNAKLDDRSMLKLKLTADQAKIDLCTKVANYYKNLPDGSLEHSFYHTFDGLSTPVKYTITEKLFNDLMQEFYTEIDKLLYDADIGVFKENRSSKSAVKKILLVGGSSKIPWIRQYFAKELPHATIFEGVDPDLAIAKGACIDAVNADPNSGDSSLMVLGAAPLNIGIKLSTGLMQVIIKEGTTIPTQQTMNFTTTVDNQKKVDIEVGMGNRPLFEQNINVGVFELILAGDKPANVPKIEVTIEIFSDYSFKVSAIEADTGRQASVVYNSELGKPADSKVKKMIEEAEKHKAEDEQLKEKLETISLYESAFKRFSAQIQEAEKNPSAVSELELSEFISAQELHKEFLETQAKTAVLSVVKQKLTDISLLGAQLEEKLKSAKPADKVPTPEQQPEEQGKDAGRDAL